MSSVRWAAAAACVGWAALWGAAADAQVFRIVGPDGRVTFSDRPPPDAKAVPAPTVPMAASTAAPSGGTLPLELRNVTSRYPVTLYTSAECGPCNSARNFLTRRGVPFTERTIASEDDAAALLRLSGGNKLPFATVGGQHLAGFSDSEWAQYLDAAGYPKVSQLPPTYRNPAPTPLVAVQKPTLPAAQQQAEQGQAQPATQGAINSNPGPSPSNPAGIRF